MTLENIILNVIEEQEIPKGRISKSLVTAITNRNPVTFYYSGPRDGKDSVKPGARIRAEVVAMGLSKGGNVIVRAHVQPPSVSKKGYGKTNWRTFRIDRMSSVKILTDETFDTQRPEYKTGEESAMGPMVKTYVTTDWGVKQEPKTPEIKQKVKQTEPKPVSQELPQPKSSEKPTVTPEIEPKDLATDVFKTLQPKDVNGQKTISTQDFQNAANSIYRLKQDEWKAQQRELGKNVNPGSGTRKRLEMDSNTELSNLLSKDNVNVSDEQPQPEIEGENNLQESINRIKTLMLL